MVGLLGYAMAGVVQGAGNGLVEQAKARREDALRELEHGRMMEREQSDRAFRREENETNRKFQAAENEKTRSASGDVMTLEDGTAAVRQGTTIKPITGTDGKPVKTLRKSTTENAPAEVQTAEWLVRQGVASNVNEAWEMVRSARSDPERSRAAIFTKWVDTLTKNNFGQVDGEKIKEEAKRLTDETIKFLDASDAPSAAPVSPKATGTEKGAAYPEAPRDPGQRKSGQIYTSPSGKKGRWTGAGWEIVE